MSTTRRKFTPLEVLNRITSSTDPTGAKTTTSYDTVGRTTTVTDPEGGKTTLEYDLMDRVIRKTDPAKHHTPSRRSSPARAATGAGSSKRQNFPPQPVR